MTIRLPLPAVLAALLLAAAPPALGAQLPGPRVADSTGLRITRPTVIAYLVIAPGEVDSNPDMAVVADDWNYAMSILGDTIEARGWAFTMAIDSVLVVRRPGRAKPDTLALGRAGYVLVPMTGAPCVGGAPMDPEEVVAAATRFFTARATTRRCTLPTRE